MNLHLKTSTHIVVQQCFSFNYSLATWMTNDRVNISTDLLDFMHDVVMHKVRILVFDIMGEIIMDGAYFQKDSLEGCSPLYPDHAQNLGHVTLTTRNVRKPRQNNI